MVMKKVDAVFKQVRLLLRKFTKPRRSNGKNRSTEYCAICMEDTYMDRMFLIETCLHSYCFVCMSEYVKSELLRGGRLPTCPHEDCETELKLESCKVFLSPQLFEIMRQRVREASIPAEKKMYCPYPKCSTLLSKSELVRVGYSSNVNERLNSRKCPKCRGIVCKNCKVPWHKNMECSKFNPGSSNEEKTLKSLATRKRWRQCPKCNHMVSLASGCSHIYCRCGHEFCYTCGAEWKNMKPTCKCF